MSRFDGGVTAVVAVHNRKNSTLLALDALTRSACEADVSLSIVMVDDGSSDGTASAVRSRFPAVETITGDGNLYWGGAMRLGLDRALEISRDAHILLLNDDAVLRPTGLRDLLVVASSRGTVAVGGVGPSTTEMAYGPLIRERWPFGFAVLPADYPVGWEVDAFQANAVLVPTAAFESIGTIDAAFRHNMGDIDLSLRLREAGWTLRFAGHVALGEPNPHGDGAPDAGRQLRERLKYTFGVKGAPPRATIVLHKRHAGPLWGWYACRSIASRAARAIAARNGRRR